MREGYKFLGCYSNNALFDFNTPVTTNLELVARWEKVEDNLQQIQLQQLRRLQLKLKNIL